MQLNGLLPPETSDGVPQGLDVEVWAAAEAWTAELITRIQPNEASEVQRRAVACYVQRVIMNCFPCQVFAFGSVPLKTYLPDGDIDLTAFCNNDEFKDKWAELVQDALKREEKSENAQFHVKEVQFINAEVKIIKCLVENIVVDISFNQVGGLCTLCFLEEVDNLINHNHLFKRSIILIKAWCYYESRILGAHHGLISTYALETLVLYIFHVFNNNFAGPLEVLYRFLEFFSCFDWEKFCVSLSGPVLIESFPNMKVLPPRCDDGALFLKKDFLESCSANYAVIPIAQDNLGHSFVSKHFNVIDPLRTNNNLGRSVSKGNFFRIRSAFALGAKRLARLLDCPKENLLSELNQFFRNTWERHGTGDRPDAPSLSASLMNRIAPNEESVISAGSYRNASLHVWQGKHGNHDYHDPTSQLLNKIGSHSETYQRISNLSVPHLQSQKLYAVPINVNVPNHSEENSRGSITAQNENDKRTSKWNMSVNDLSAQFRCQFVRTRSSPELTDSYVETLPYGRHGRDMEKGKIINQDDTKHDNSCELTVNTMPSVDDAASYASQQSAYKAASETQSLSNSFSEEINFSEGADFTSVSKVLEKQHERNQEEQNLINRMPSANLQDLNAQIHLPMQMASPYPVLASSPFLVSSVPPRNMSGVVPSNIPLVGASWIPNMQFLQGFVAPPMTHYAHNPAFTSNFDDGEPIQENSIPKESFRDGINDLSEQGTASTKRRDIHSVNLFKQHLHEPGIDDGLRSASFPIHPKNVREGPSHGRDDHVDMLYNQIGRVPNVNNNLRSANTRFPSTSQTSSMNSKSIYDISWDDSSGRMRRQSREKWGKRPTFGADNTSHFHARMKPGWQSGNLPENGPSEFNDDTRVEDHPSIAKLEVLDRISASGSLSAHSKLLQVPEGHEASESSLPSPVFPIAPVLLGHSQQRMADKSGAPPIFYPTGPPVPVIMFIPRNSTAPVPQFERSHSVDRLLVNAGDGNCSTVDASSRSDVNVSSVASGSTGPHESSDELRSDILNSDFATHLQNLQIGRDCQNNPQLPGPFVHPSAVLPPGHLQGQFLQDGSGRLLSPNSSIAQMMSYGPRLVPLMPIQPGSERTAPFQRHGEESSRFRGGTGTYLPNPSTQKISPRDRQSNARSFRGGYNNDRGDHVDKVGSWLSSKHRSSFRGHGRNPSERLNAGADRVTSDENQFDRRWSSRDEPFKHETTPVHLVRPPQFESANSLSNKGNITFGMYSPPTTNSNGVDFSESPMAPLVMAYPYDRDPNIGLPSEALEFGSFRSAPSDGRDTRHHVNEVNLNGFYDPRNASYRDGSSSPDQPCSPHLRR